MIKKKFREPVEQVGLYVPLRNRAQVEEIQNLHGDVSMSQIWRKAIDIGLAQLLKDARALKLDG